MELNKVHQLELVGGMIIWSRLSGDDPSNAKFYARSPSLINRKMRSSSSLPTLCGRMHDGMDSEQKFFLNEQQASQRKNYPLFRSVADLNILQINELVESWDKASWYYN